MTDDLIYYRPDDYFIALRRDHMHICSQRLNSALILAVFEYWTNVKRKKNPYEEAWIYKSYEELIQDTMGGLTRYAVIEAVDHLMSLGLLERRHNPNYRYDRKYQYRLNVDLLRELLADYYR